MMMMLMMIRSEFQHQRIQQLSYPQGVEWSEFIHLLNLNENRSLMLHVMLDLLAVCSVVKV